jgi:hypothetical protein
MKIRQLAILILTTASCMQAQAASQGVASTTSSSGSFVVTANGPATPRTVQVLNLSDATFSNTNRPDNDANFIGTTMTFCVVDTYGGASSISLTSANGGLGNGWSLNSPAGSAVTYRVALTTAGLASLAQTPSDGTNTFSANLNAGIAATSPSTCGTGNLKANIYLLGGPMPETLPARTYSDTITVVLTAQ